MPLAAAVAMTNRDRQSVMGAAPTAITRGRKARCTIVGRAHQQER